MEFNIKPSARKTKQGYYQPVLIIDGKIKHTPADMSCPCIDKTTAIKQAHIWRHESILCGYVTEI